MKRIHIVGRKNSGKTTLIVDLVQHLTANGYRVGTIKHTHHRHELDTPGKDSHLHREAGAVAVGILSPGITAIFRPTDDEAEDTTKRYAQLAPVFADCDVVLVEGNLQTTAFKAEVWRSATDEQPIAAENPSIAAIITDDLINLDLPKLRRSDIGEIARQLLTAADAS